MTPTPIPGDTPEAKHTDTLVDDGKKYPLGDSVWICTHMPECGPYFASAVEAEGEYGGEAVEFVRSDRIEQLEAENAELRAKLEKAEAAVNFTTFMVTWLDSFLTSDRNDTVWDTDMWRDAKRRCQAALTEQANIRSPVQSQMAKMVDPRKDTQ